MHWQQLWFFRAYQRWNHWRDWIETLLADLQLAHLQPQLIQAHRRHFSRQWLHSKMDETGIHRFLHERNSEENSGK